MIFPIDFYLSSPTPVRLKRPKQPLVLVSKNIFVFDDREEAGVGSKRISNFKPDKILESVQAHVC